MVYSAWSINTAKFFLPQLSGVMYTALTLTRFGSDITVQEQLKMERKHGRTVPNRTALAPANLTKPAGFGSFVHRV